MTLKEKIEELKKEAALIHQHIGGVDNLRIRITAPLQEMKEYNPEPTLVQNPDESYFIIWQTTNEIEITVISEEKYRTILEPINATEQSR